MAYNGIAWPGLTLPVKKLNAERAKIVRWIKLVEEKPTLFKSPKRVREKYAAMLAQYDTALKVLRDVQRAAEAPAKVKRPIARPTAIRKRVTVEDAMAGKIL